MDDAPSVGMLLRVVAMRGFQPLYKFWPVSPPPHAEFPHSGNCTPFTKPLFRVAGVGVVVWVVVVNSTIDKAANSYWYMQYERLLVILGFFR